MSGGPIRSASRTELPTPTTPSLAPCRRSSGGSVPVALAVLVAVLVGLQAYVFPGVVSGPAR